MIAKTLYIHTIGCQMNVYDAGRMAGLLAPLGYVAVQHAAVADLVVVNTCAIRAKAEQKVFSLLGRLAEIKRQRPEMRLAVGGCVAQQEGCRILERCPAVDLVFGTHALERLPELVRKIASGERRLVDIAPTAGGLLPMAAPHSGAATAFVTIMQGCDNHCTYCVVPHVRGPERSRSPGEIVAEVEELVNRGVREVTLLGQNVNSYGRKEGLPSFASLLSRVEQVNDLLRIRFTTSHPKDLSEELMAAFHQPGKLCDHIHLPVQSGANHILRRMNRHYSREQYLEQVARLRQYRPGIAITSDVIVGFPGETAFEFGQTLDLIRAVSFDSLFVFAYSDRPSAPARLLPAKVAEREKKNRLDELLRLQEAITLEKNQAFVGCVVEILVEGPSRKSASGEAAQWSGRTSTNHIVNFVIDRERSPAPMVAPGQLLTVRIERALAHSLLGVSLAEVTGLIPGRGERRHAA